MKFFELLDAIVRWLWDDEETLSKVKSWRMYFTDWPDSPARRAAERYESLREQKGHTYAAIKTEEEFGREISDKTRVPDEHTLRRLYFESVNQAVALELGKMLVRYPDRGKELVDSAKFLSTAGEPIHFGTSIDQFVKRMVAAQEAGESIVEIPGWPKLSQAIGGFNPGRVGLLVAKTGFGKTNFAASLAIDASELVSTLFVNMEMLTEDFAEKLIMASGGITYREMRHSLDLVADKILKVQEENISRRLFFTDGQTMSVPDLEQLVRSFRENNDLRLLIVDYDQKIKIKTSKETPEWKALQIAVETLESIAKKHRIYCLLLAQESSESDGKHRGRVSGSNRSTFPASTVLNFYRSEDEDGEPFIVEAVKNRFGPRGARVEVVYRPETSRVTEKGLYESKEFGRSDSGGSQTRHRTAIPRPSWHDRDS